MARKSGGSAELSRQQARTSMVATARWGQASDDRQAKKSPLTFLTFSSVSFALTSLGSSPVINAELTVSSESAVARLARSAICEVTPAAWLLIFALSSLMPSSILPSCSLRSGCLKSHRVLHQASIGEQAGGRRAGKPGTASSALRGSCLTGSRAHTRFPSHEYDRKCTYR